MSGSSFSGSSDVAAGVAPSVCLGGGGEGEESSMKRMRPRTEFGCIVDDNFGRRVVSEEEEESKGGGISRIQTAALSVLPEPRRMAGRPVDWMVRIMVDGGVVPVVVSMEVGREKVVEWIPIYRCYQIVVVD